MGVGVAERASLLISSVLSVASHVASSTNRRRPICLEGIECARDGIELLLLASWRRKDRQCGGYQSRLPQARHGVSSRPVPKGYIVGARDPCCQREIHQNHRSARNSESSHQSAHIRYERSARRFQHLAQSRSQERSPGADCCPGCRHRLLVVWQFRVRAFRAWGPLMLLQLGVLGVVLNIKVPVVVPDIRADVSVLQGNAEETKVPIHGGASPYMDSEAASKHVNSTQISASLDAKRKEKGLTKVQVTPSSSPFQQPRNSGPHH